MGRARQRPGRANGGYGESLTVCPYDSRVFFISDFTPSASWALGRRVPRNIRAPSHFLLRVLVIPFYALSDPPGHTVSLAFEVRHEIFVYGMFVQRRGRAPTKDPIATSNLLQLHLRICLTLNGTRGGINHRFATRTPILTQVLETS